MVTRLSKVSVLSILATCVALGTWSASAGANSIAVHFYDYANNNPSIITGTDGAPGYVVPNWNNVDTNWYSLNTPSQGVNLVDSAATQTTAAVTVTPPNNGGTYWWTWPSSGTENLLKGPGGGNGNDQGRNLSAIPAVISGITYQSYEMIAYGNDVGYNANLKMWLDSAPGSTSAPTNAAAGPTYYFSSTQQGSTFIPVTNTDPTALTAGNYAPGNYMVFTGLSGPNQTLWIDGYNSANANFGITGFEIVDTSSAPEPASLGLIGLASLLLLRRRR